MDRLLNHEPVKPLLSDEQFSVDGTLIEAWASHKSVKPKDDQDGDGEDFRAPQRATDSDSRLDRTSQGQERRRGYMGHATMENRSRLAVAGMVTHAGGRAERRASLKMLKKIARKKTRRLTAGADKADETRDHVADLRANHAAQGLRPVADLPQDDRVRLWLGQATRHDAQDHMAWPGPCRFRVHAQSDQLQPRPHSKPAGGDGIVCSRKHNHAARRRRKSDGLQENIRQTSHRMKTLSQTRVFQQTASVARADPVTECSPKHIAYSKLLRTLRPVAATISLIFSTTALVTVPLEIGPSRPILNQSNLGKV